MSEMTELLQRIEEECQVMHRAMYDYACVASHDVIQARYNTLGSYEAALAKQVGTEQATALLIEAYTRIIG